MHSLLSLPREIRDQIIEQVLLFRKEPPQDPAHDNESRQDAIGQGALRPPTILPSTYNALGLLETNIQLKDETQSRLEQLNLSYSLDVMVVDNELWPTWTCCPSRVPGPIDTVNVSLRFFSKGNDPYMVHVARTCWAILQGRKWTNASLHPLAETFLHIRDVCLQPGSKDAKIGALCFNAATSNRLDNTTSSAPSEPLSSVGLKSLFGKHRSLWNSFRSIHQYQFASTGEARRLELVASLKIMVLLFLQEAWEDECTTYTSYVGPLGSAFRSVQDVHFAVDGQNLEQLTSSVLST
ncbi:hypothetical protein BU25DRAFT_61314 [Macroventuria anomochaeta]|uniref:Uncharacterized protein n=1 Tax=Macroventuria anomochaeta TaxID=301207 RepID=A0ACB6RZW7_9PLEO|nr:uncharacterized protein BU25DRAFT_61314 [Macroventuria anomochaeta]KAF2627319.1 hypothetical protein BU25DRAFT_61314 [Macroventuria anomochaeta]